MKFLLISDIHGNVAALEAILNKEGDDFRVINLGDVCGYYPFANECITLLRDLDAISILGNHDIGVCEGLNSAREQDYIWQQTRESLSPSNLEWLQSLNSSTSIDAMNTTLYLHHSNPLNDDQYLYPDHDLNSWKFEKGLTLLGHTHIQMYIPMGESAVMNPGSVGQPRNGRPGADYAVLDLSQGWIEFKHLDYDLKSLFLNDESKFSILSTQLLSRIDQTRFERNPCGFGKKLLPGIN